jgi:hypothetical protein
MANLSPERREGLRLKYQLRLNQFLNDFNDDVPNHVTHGPTRETLEDMGDFKGDYKHRAQWWAGVLSNFYYAAKNGFIADPSFKEEVEKFYKFYQKKTQDRIEKVQEDSDLTPEIIEETKQDIQAANAMIRKVLAVL